jgi:hypothetical protein
MLVLVMCSPNRSIVAPGLTSLVVMIALAACGGGTGSSATVPAEEGTRAQSPSAANSVQWTPVADEWERFTVTGTQVTRYGVEGHWIEKTFTDTVVDCSNSTYGDPLVGTRKRCEVASGGGFVGGGASITVKAASESCEGRADLALRIGGVEVTRWLAIEGNARDASPQYQTLTYQHGTDFALTDVEVAYVNEYSSTTCNRNVRVESVEVTRSGGAIERVALASQITYSTGTWSNADKCSGRNVQSEWLDCNGAFSFAGVAPTAPPMNGATIDTTYEADGSALLNPERGFHDSTSMVTSTLWGAPSGNGSYAAVRAAGQTLVRGVALLERHRSGPLPDSVLTELRQSFALARNNGMKVWFLAAYNFPNGAGGEQDPSINIDPELEVVLGHLDQLKPVFEENKDVLAGLYNGFIGAWGEWHTSSTGLDKDPKRRQIWDKLLQVVPADRAITVRQFEPLNTLPATHPTKATAYDQSAGSRTGMSNQCYLVSYTDAGTFVDRARVAEHKAQLAQWTQFVPFVGETCEVPYREGNRNDCPSAKAEHELLHLTSLNGVFYKPTIDGWKAGGCYDEINNRMGYRFELTRSSIQRSAQAGSALALNFVVRNVGYAAPFNPRELTIVLRNQATGARHAVSILQPRSDTLDPRRWYREAGNLTVAAAPVVPADVPAGTYDVLLSLHDPMPSLSQRPEYSIRLANKGVWDDATGANKIASGVTITR